MPSKVGFRISFKIGEKINISISKGFADIAVITFNSLGIFIC